MTSRTVTKALIAREDFAHGQGTASQTRQGVSTTVNQVDLPWILTSLAEIDVLDTTKYKHCIYDSGTRVTLYRYDASSAEVADDYNYINPIVGTGQWVRCAGWDILLDDALVTVNGIQSTIQDAMSLRNITANSLAALALLDLSGVDRASTISFRDGAEKGGADYVPDGNTGGSASTIYADNTGFYDQTGLGFSLATDQEINMFMFGAYGDAETSGTDDSTYNQYMYDFISANGLEATITGKHKIVTPATIYSSDSPKEIIIKKSGDGELWFYNTTARITTNAFVGPAIYQYIDEDYPNNPHPGIEFIGVTARGKVSASVDHYLFCSFGYNGGALITGQTTARVNNFRMVGCRLYDIEGHMCYGSNFQSYANIATNTLASAVQLDRHYAFAFNHYIAESSNTYDDTVMSDCEIHHNTATMYGGAVLVHSYFNLSDNTRRVIKNAEVHNITCNGGDESAAIISRAPIYIASAIRVRVHDCYLYYGEDVGIDFENCQDAEAYENHLENCNLAQFWDTDRTIFRDNTVIINDQDWYDDTGIFAREQFVRKSGSQANGLVACYRNKFICSLSGADRLGKVASSVAVADLEFIDNEFLNGWIDAGYDIPRVNTKINRNKFRFDKVIGDYNIVDLDAMGWIELEDNEVQNYTVVSDTISRITQATAYAAFNIKMNRYTGTQDARKLSVKRNKGIYGWPNSFEFTDGGASAQRWTIEFIDNEYDGYVIAETVSNCRMFIKDNRYTYDVDDGTAGVYTAWPASPTDAGDMGATTGTDDTSSAAAFLTDSGASWSVNAFVGKTVINSTDGSRGVITANTATTVTATLSGGTNNNWDSGDSYAICNTTTGIGFRGGSEITLYGSAVTGTGNPYKYIMGVESAQTWSTLNLP